MHGIRRVFDSLKRYSGMVWAAGRIALIAGAIATSSYGPASVEERNGSATMHAARALTAKVRLGIDVLAARRFAPLQGLRVGLLTHDAGRDAAGRRTIDVLAAAPEIKLVAIFSPEHGLASVHEGNVDHDHDATTGLPVTSLYGAIRRPPDHMLDGLDAVVIDLQDVGVRFYTYATTMAYMLEAAARRRLPVVVLDRPNPIAPAGVHGPVLDRALRSFVGYFPMPVMHGMTIGELASLFNAENQLGAQLTVVPMTGYKRTDWHEATGLAWVNPSPNLKAVAPTLLYPGIGLVELTNVSVGRGTPTPFELVGAPWIDGHALADYLRGRAVPGVAIQPAEFTPRADRFAGRRCHGVLLQLTDRGRLDAVRLGVELAVALRRLHPTHFRAREMASLLGSSQALAGIEAGEDAGRIAARWQPARAAFMTLRAKHLMPDYQ